MEEQHKHPSSAFRKLHQALRGNRSFEELATRLDLAGYPITASAICKYEHLRREPPPDYFKALVLAGYRVKHVRKLKLALRHTKIAAFDHKYEIDEDGNPDNDTDDGSEKP